MIHAFVELKLKIVKQISVILKMKDVNHSSAMPRFPLSFLSERQVYCGTIVSNVALRSNKTKITTLPTKFIYLFIALILICFDFVMS